MTIKFYPIFDTPQGPVGHHLCDSCAGGRRISQDSPVTECDSCGESSIDPIDVIADILGRQVLQKFGQEN